MNTTRNATALALAALAFGACTKQAPQTAAPDATTTSGVRCQGINSCKGMGQCNGPGHSCGKHTPCKGQGWLVVEDADACAAKGGTLL
ncbi:MAG: hypothetical protein U0168_08865 [Nannocystaceae bacterium]|jgi:hypothetical protein